LKALIVYGTRWGGTTAIAEKISEILTQEGFNVEIANAKRRPNTIIQYDLIIIGSGIRADKWTKQAINFLEENAELLRAKKTALFVSCQMADREAEARDKARTLYLEKTAETYSFKPVSFGFFGGFLDFHKSHGLLVDIMVRVNRKSLRRNGLDISKTYDKRDWKSIEAWARELAEKCIS
jgi:menaquinone-dependent protoporphyrinogen IX oxidase